MRYLILFLGLFSLLVACGQLDTTTPEVNEELTPLLVHDSSVTLEDFSGSLQVSQGHGEVVLNIQGFELSGLKRAVLVSQQSIFGSRSNGQKATSYELKILEQTEKSARLQALIPHGSPLGAYDLKLNASKPITVMKVLTITPIISSPSGDDLTGKGTPDNPFRSLTRAVSVAQKGDFIKLDQGEYNTANGEVFPIAVDNMTISGEAAFNTTLKGGAPSDCLTVTNKGVTLSNLTIRECGALGLRLESGSSTLTKVKLLDNNFSGLQVSNTAQVSITDSDFSDNAGSGILAVNSAAIIFQGDLYTNVDKNAFNGLQLMNNASATGKSVAGWGNNHGLSIDGPGVMVDLKDGGFNDNDSHGVFIANSQQVRIENLALLANKGHGIAVSGNTTLEFVNSNSFLNMGDGIHVNVQGGEIAHLILDNATFNFNTRGIDFHSDHTDSSLFMRDSELEGNISNGLYLTGNSQIINLGTIPNPGNNLFVDSGSTNLLDARLPNSGVIKAVGTDFEMAAVLHNASGLKVGPAHLLPYWHIVNMGNLIAFGPF